MFAQANETGTGAAPIAAEELEKEAPALPELPEEGATPAQIKAYKDAVQTLPPRLAHWRKKHDTVAADPRLKVEIKPTTPPGGAGSEGMDKRVATLEQGEEKRSFGYKHKLSPGETDRLFGYAQGLGVKPEDALKDDFFQAGLADTRRREQNGNGIPGSSARRPVVEGKDWSKLKPEEKRENYGGFLKSVGADRRPNGR